MRGPFYSFSPSELTMSDNIKRSKCAANPYPSQKYLLNTFSYDPETGDLFWKERPDSDFNCPKACARWNRKYPGTRAGYIDSSDGYWKLGIRGVYYRNHRLIMIMHHGDIPEGMEIDHINGVRHDNRLINLRIVTKSENQRNTSRNRDFYRNGPIVKPQKKVAKQYPTKEEILHLFDYDRDNGRFIWKNGRPSFTGKVAGSFNKTAKLMSIYFNYQNYSTRRLIWIVENGDVPETHDIIHKDGDSHNCHISNLACETRRKRMFDAGLQSNNTTGIKGVCHDKVRGKFKAMFKLYGRIINVGRFDTKEEAEDAMIKAKEEYGVYDT